MLKDDLKEYKYLIGNIKDLENRLLELETTATNITTKIDDMPKGSPSKDKLSSVVCKIVEVQDLINDNLKKSYEKMADIEKALCELTEREKMLIRLRYIDGMKWDEIADKMVEDEMADKVTPRTLRSWDAIIFEKFE